jgi:hypothetical protein
MNAIYRLIVYSFACTVMCAVCFLVAVAQLPPAERCDTWLHVLSKDNPEHTVWYVEEGCSGFSNGDTVSLALSQTNGTRTVFFTFDDASWDVEFHGQTDPSIKWTARNHLEVSVGAVGAVVKKLDKVGEVSITYNIGHVLYK